MADTLRDTFFGQIVHRLSGGKAFQFREEKADFVVPEQYKSGYKEKLAERRRQNGRSEGKQEKPQVWGHGEPVTTPGGDQFYDAHHDARSIRNAEGQLATPGEPTSDSASSARTLGADTPSSPGDDGRMLEANRQGVENEKLRHAAQGHPEPEPEKDPYIVDWYSDDDPENPLNWSLVKRTWVTFCLCFLTFSVYMGSSIVTPGLEEFAMEHNLGISPAALSISLFVFGYGLGPMVLSPLSEVRKALQSQTLL